jgi:Phage tail sheath C-terminal domain
MVLTRPRRLPGFRFAVQAPPLVDILPRMDIAVFVGFASAGPLHTPVPVESAAQFQEIFGDDLPLAWDAQGGQPIYAYLGPAIRDFFRNGGRRCWIIRVGGAASAVETVRRPETDFFAVPGLVEFQNGKLRPAFARARSPGAWFDSFEVGTALLSDGLVAVPADPGRWTAETAMLDVSIPSPGDLIQGDLVRLDFPAEGLIAFMHVESINPPPIGSAPGQSRFRVVARRLSWFQLPDPTNRPISGQATIFSHAVERIGIPATVGSWPGDNESPLSSPPRGTSVKSEAVTLNLGLPMAEAPLPGTLLRVEFSTGELWLTIQAVTLENEEGSPPRSNVQVTGEAWWFRRGTRPVPASPSLAQRLTFELWLRRGNEFISRLEDLAFGERHPRFWYALPADLDLYDDPDFDESLRQAQAETYEALWREAATPRFPLAGELACSNKVFLPLGMSALPVFIGPENSGADPLVREALDNFGPELFLDADLVEPTVTGLLAQADFIRYQSPVPRRLLGIHAAMGIEEVTIIAVPDAVHLGWHSTNPVLPPDQVISEPLERPKWWHFKECRPQLVIPRTREPAWGHFLPCSIRIVPRPLWILPSPPASLPNSTGSFTLSWTIPDETQPTGPMQFVLQEAREPGFNDPAPIYTGSESSVKIFGRSAGFYYYRVRLVLGDQSSDWSESRPVVVSLASRWEVNGPTDITIQTWLAVHRSLLRMAAGRGDLFAVLTLPEHYRTSDAIDYASGVRSPSGPTIAVHGRQILPLGPGDANALSYAACYHPWVIERDTDGNFHDLPSDGVVCGILARRAVSRGAWVAPANEFLTGVVSLTPAIDRENWLDLQEARINLLRQEPRGFLVLDADTLSNDEDLRPISVRRLMILLRRLALREGATDAFEPNDDSLRRVVQHRFEEFLNQLYARGAFAGNTAAEAFEVNTGEDVNTPGAVDQGRLIVELKVAPAFPLTFLTIRLVQIGDRAAVLELG